jgi:hypothetical protein
MKLAQTISPVNPKIINKVDFQSGSSFMSSSSEESEFFADLNV